VIAPGRDKTAECYFSGEATLPLAEICAPSKESTREMLIQLRQSLGLSRGHMAALLGIRKDHLRRWEKGSRKPSRPAQKLIWLIHSMAHESHPIQDAFTLITWGRLK
jgi:DNA-binding transcriptional regulator YiaG